MSGLIAVISDHASRYTWFHHCLSELERDSDVKTVFKMGANRGALRTALAQQCLDEGHEWIFFIDDDQAFPARTLTRLLAHGQPVVSALIFHRAAPFLPTAYYKGEQDYNPLDLASVGHNNLVQVDAAGTGGLLIRAEVLEQVTAPWFVYTENRGEDLYFSERLQEADIPMLVDTGCRIGHIAPAAVFPFWNTVSSSWAAQFMYADGTSVNMVLNHERE